jgi:type I restriction enzyme S subunit
LHKADYVEDGVPLINPINIIDGRIKPDHRKLISKSTRKRLSSYILEEGDVVVARRGEIGRCAVIGAKEAGWICGTGCFFIRPLNTLDSEFLAQLLRSPVYREKLEQLARGATMLNLSNSALARLKISVPPLAEQRRIVAGIEALFARTRRARTDLERIAPLSDRHRLAYLRAGVTGQLTEAWRQKHPTEDVRVALRRIPVPEQGRGGREATTDVTPGMAALSVNNPETFTPPGWAWTPLLRVARQETGHTPSRRVPAYWDGGDVPWVGIRDAGAHHGTTIYDTMQKCTELGLANSSARLLPAGTVCLSRTASVGYVTVLGKSMATSQDFATWTCTSALLPEYLKFALLAEGEDIRRFGEGSTHTTIYFPEIRALHICLPPIEEQAEIVRMLTSNAGGQMIASTEAVRALSLLDRLEQSILTRAFRGELVRQHLDDTAIAALGETGVVASPAARRIRGSRAA